ncbi:efflux transporter outer membrane subunit [Novosphingobium mathurense]|uniref:Efflux transporter, outer membrane factor (OMF) lipoprotein, NodT family n=1 Tax=Novosphingobium mathurense TaxID=428990 RepID=A0A1U6GZF7_9SPHN|nr:efflux transporter outer membrane subunit [Novosphingobium mathurense]SLJ88904.1 efflux transporter, outer membrane factor (OMF) lipoprotein, NodT family [Novosphingobium mathurense]
MGISMRPLTLILLLATGACSMTPKLNLPPAPVADSYPGADTAATAEALPAWRGMFGDPRLQRLIALSLDANRDLRIAALNAEAARAQRTVQRAQSLPSINAEGGYSRQRQPAGATGAAVGGTSGNGATGIEFGQFTAQAALTSFEIDLFGRLRALNEAAFHRWLSSVEARHAVRLNVIGTVVDAYLNERLAEEQLSLTRSTLADWETSLDISRRLKAAGQASGVDLAQAEGLVRQAQADLAQRERELAQASNALTLAVGAPLPGDLPPPISLMDQPIRTELNAGTPSDLLIHRPDIAQAEQELRAANADVGAARAAFFPRISLTAAFGFASRAFEGLFQGANRSWSYSPAISVPVFRGGELRGNLDIAKLRTSTAVATYEKTIQTAFREVADGLAARATYATQLTELRAVVTQAQRRASLAQLSYSAGMSSRLELLDAQRATYAAQQAALVVRRDELASAAALYRALGGDTGQNTDTP